jgi:hypothetical protein
MKLPLLSSLVLVLADQSLAGRIGVDRRERSLKAGKKSKKSDGPSGPVTYEPGNYDHPNKYLTK